MTDFSHLRFIPRSELPVWGIKWSTVHLRRLSEAGLFPKPRVLGRRTLAWRESDIIAFLNGTWKPDAPDAPKGGEALDIAPDAA